MKLKLVFTTVLQVCLLTSIYAQLEIENTEENCPDRGANPCNRNTPIQTDPFNPVNNEWFTQRNGFNWMDYVTWHEEKR